MPMPSRCTSAHWQYEKRPLVPIIPMLRFAERSCSLVPSSGALCRCRTAVQAVAGNTRKSSWSRSSRRCISLNNLAICTKLKVAMPMPSRCTSGHWQYEKKSLVPIIPMLRLSLNGLATLYQAEGRYADAEPLYKQSLAIKEKVLGPNHPAIAVSLNNLAWLYASDRSLC